MYSEYFNIINSDIKSDSLIVNILFYSLVVLFFFISLRKRKSKLVKVLPFVAVAGLIAIVGTTIKNDKPINNYKKIVLEHKHEIIEGIVESSNQDFNSLGINSVEYSFINSAYFKEPITVGRSVRAFVYEGKILGLWLKDE